MEYKPLKMQPVYKDYVWGGSRLKNEYGKADAPERTAESWELSCLPGNESRVAGGEDRGKTLPELARGREEEFFGRRSGGSSPLLVKLIDARDELSVQVHPSDAKARKELGERGKAEMWYIVDARPNAFLYLGFSRNIGAEEFRRRALDGSVCQVLNRVSVGKGDVFYITPGTVHAIGRGLLVAEVQQSSDTTFRVYDHGRVGSDGQPRPLHVEEAVRVADYRPLLPERCRANNITVFPEFTLSEMFSCAYFRSYRIEIRQSIRLRCDGESFHHILCVEGTGEIRCGGERYPLRRGESWFFPARLGDYELGGQCTVLLSWL